MKKILNLLCFGNLTPKERILLQINHSLNLERTGIAILSDSDLKALTDNWETKDYREAREYNKYLYGIQTETIMKKDIYIAYLQTQLKVSSVSRVLDYAIFNVNKDSKWKESLLSSMPISDSEVISFILKNSGLNYDYLVEEYPKMKTELDKLVKQEILSIEIFEDQIFDLKVTVKLITGESIHKLPDSHILKVEYQKQVEHYKYFTHILLFIQQSELFKIYGELLAMKDIYSRLVDMYEADIDYYLNDLIKELDESIEQINKEIIIFLSKIKDENCNSVTKFSLDMHIYKIFFRSPEKNYECKLYSRYIEEFKAIFSYEFEKK